MKIKEYHVDDTMMVVTCKKCRAWYSMDFEYPLDDEHFDFKTGEECYASDNDWDIRTVQYREDWDVVY